MTKQCPGIVVDKGQVYGINEINKVMSAVVCLVLFLEGTEQVSECLTAWVADSMNNDAPASPVWVAIDFVGTQTWCDIPDVAEGDAGEVAAPAHGNGDATKRRQDDVAQGLPQVVTFVGVLPHAVDAVGVIRFTNRLLE